MCTSLDLTPLLHLLPPGRLPAWRLFVGLCSIPSLIAALSMLMLPESPRWLANTGRLEEADAVISLIARVRPIVLMSVCVYVSACVCVCICVCVCVLLPPPLSSVYLS